MKYTIILSVLAALPMLAQCPCGDKPCAPKAPACQCAHRHMNPQAMEAMKAKFMEKFDTNKDGQLSDEEKAEVKKHFEAKHAEMKAKFMEKFDTNKDGQLSDEEKAEVKKAFEAKKAEWMAKHGQKPGMRHGRHHGMRHGKPGMGHGHHGMKHGKPCCGKRPQLSAEQKEAMKAKFMEKFDTNKDGQLSDEEKAEVKKFFEAKKAEWMAKKGQKPCCGKPGMRHGRHHGMRHGKPGMGHRHHGMKPCCKPGMPCGKPCCKPAPAPQAAPAPAPAPEQPAA